MGMGPWLCVIKMDLTRSATQKEVTNLGNSCSNYTHSHFRHQLHTDSSLRIGTLQIVNELKQSKYKR